MWNKKSPATKVAGLFQFFKRDISFDVDRVKQAFSDSSISIHFLFIASPVTHTFGVRMQERSDDIYAAFEEMSRATGGYVQSSGNPDYLMKKAVQASENYYLLFYSPRNYKGDGSFKEIRVRLKDKNFRVTHRLGYFAN